MKISVFFLRLFFLALLCGQGVVSGQLDDASAPPVEGGDVEQEFNQQFVEWPNIENGRETFGGRLTFIKNKNEMVFIQLKERLGLLKNEFGYISRVKADALVSTVFNTIMYVKWSDIENGLETFDNKLPYIRAKNKKVYDTLLKDLQQFNAPDDVAATHRIVRAQATQLIETIYNQIAYMRCEDIDKPESPVYNKLLSIQSKDNEAYTMVVAELKSARYCTNGRITRDAVEARVHAVYVRVYVAWLSAAGFYYTKNFAQTTYNWITSALIPAISYAVSNGYAYVKEYGARVLEKNRQRVVGPTVVQLPASRSPRVEQQSPSLLATVPPAQPPIIQVPPPPPVRKKN